MMMMMMVLHYVLYEAVLQEEYLWTRIPTPYWCRSSSWVIQFAQQVHTSRHVCLAKRVYHLFAPGSTSHLNLQQ